MKYLLLAVLVFVVWTLLKKQRKSTSSNVMQDPASQTMVICDYCKVHLPEGDALRDGGRFYCHEAHRNAARHLDA